jgi:hypothetical protein
MENIYYPLRQFGYRAFYRAGQFADRIPSHPSDDVTITTMRLIAYTLRQAKYHTEKFQERKTFRGSNKKRLELL